MNVTMEGKLDRLEGNLVRGRSSEAARLYRLRIDGRWYFCQANGFHRSKEAGAILRGLSVPAQVTAAAYVSQGRSTLCWLHVHESGKSLRPIKPLEQATVFGLVTLLTMALAVALFYGWRWVDQWPTAGVVVALPVVLLLGVVMLFCAVASVAGISQVISLLRPQRLRAYRAYRDLYGARGDAG